MEKAGPDAGPSRWLCTSAVVVLHLDTRPWKGELGSCPLPISVATTSGLDPPGGVSISDIGAGTDGEIKRVKPPASADVRFRFG